MENPTPFDLNQAIQQWRQQIAGSPAVQHNDMNEMEDHLRDSIASLERHGLTLHEAFWIATHRLGSSDTLKAEFGKVNRSNVWLDRAQWMVLGSIAFTALSSIGHAVASLTSLGLFKLVGGRAFSQGSVLLYPFSFALLLALSWRWCTRSGSALARFGRWTWTNPIGAATIVGVFSVFLSAAGTGVSILTIRNVPAEQFGSATWIWSILRIVLLNLIAPTVVGVLLHRRRQEQRAAAQS